VAVIVTAAAGTQSAPAVSSAEARKAIQAGTPDQPNIILMITFKHGAAALDKGVEQEEVAKKVIGSTEFPNKARVGRNQYRKFLGIEYVRELILQ